MQAIILAGGFGTRLKSLLHDTPKPMALIGGKPFLHWLLLHLGEQGIREVVLCLHHMPEAVQDYFGRQFGPVLIHYSIEDKPLGTGGALKQALQLLSPKAPVFALNGDSLVQLDCREMMRKHVLSGSTITIASRRVPNCQRYSELTVEHGRITHYEPYGEAQPGRISTGFYIISPELFDQVFMPPSGLENFAGLNDGYGAEGFSFERDFLSLHTPHLLPAAYEAVDYFIDIGVPEDYLRAMQEIPQRVGNLEAA